MTPTARNDGGEVAYYREDLARAHHRGFGFHADRCAPGLLALLAPVRERGGLVVELGCGSGLLTRHLVDAGHRVLATDASSAMLAIAREFVPEAEIAPLALPDDPIPDADAIVSVGHALSYLSNADAVATALTNAARALRPRGILALDLCDLEWNQARHGARGTGWAEEDWALVAEYQMPSPDRFVRQLAVFTRNDDGSWRRDDERHDNVLVETARIPELLARDGVDAAVGQAFGEETLPPGLRTVVGHKRLPGL